MRRDPRDSADTDYRRAWGTAGRAPWGRPLRAAFYAHLPESPRSARTKDDAAHYLAQIRRVIDMEHWTPRERERLRVLERRWERRTKGLDAGYLRRELGDTRPRPRGVVARVMSAVVAAIEGSKRRTKTPRGKYAQDERWPLGRPQRGV